jgi:predicted DCC family thiol-disulfide oxidoreductase YuxK
LPGKLNTVKRAPNIVLYDDQCSMCTFQMRALTWLDWLNVVSWLPISNPRAVQVAPELTREELLEAIHCVACDRQVYRGARCIRYVGMRMPLIVPVALFLWIPGVIQVAERIYQWVSRNRHLLSRLFGCKEACRILPQRERRNEKDIRSAPRDS